MQLYHKDKSLITNGKRLTNVHISAAQNLLKSCFSHLNGLQSTMYQLTRHVENLIQIIHINQNHYGQLSVHVQLLYINIIIQKKISL